MLLVHCQADALLLAFPFLLGQMLEVFLVEGSSRQGAGVMLFVVGRAFLAEPDLTCARVPLSRTDQAALLRLMGGLHRIVSLRAGQGVALARPAHFEAAIVKGRG